MHLSLADLMLAAVALIAAIVNGGLGYGFCALTVPVALLWLPNRVLCPALVLAEVLLNGVAAAVNFRAVLAVWRRVLPMVIGIAPGVALGAWALVRSGHDGLRLATYAVLFALVVLQALGVRKAIRREAVVGPAVGAAVGALFAATAISGAPLALLLSNQGYEKDHSRAALALFRWVEAMVTALLFMRMGLFRGDALRLAGVVAPSVLVGIPLGHLLLRRVSVATLRRFGLGANALLVGMGLVRALAAKGLMVPAAGGVLVAVTAVWIGQRVRGAPGSVRLERASAEVRP